MTEADLAVIGGGPAGLATAIRGRLAGLTVRLFDRATPPIDKACGEGLMPDGVACLERLGIETAELGRPFLGVRYLADGVQATGKFSRGFGLGIRRPALHLALARRAAELGVDLNWGCAVTGIAPGTVQTSRGAVAASWVAGADGLHSRVRKWLGLKVRHGRPRFGVRRHFPVAPWSDVVEVHWSDGCEAYVTPVDEGEIGVAILWGANSGKQRFDGLLARFPRLGERLRRVRATSRDRGSGPLWSVPAGVMRGRVALVGDAAGYFDAITGEGLSMAFHQSQALIEAIVADDPSRYCVAVRRLVRWPASLIRALLFVDRRPHLQRRLIRTLAEDPGLFSRLLAVHARQLPKRAVGLGGAGRLLFGLALAR